MHKPLTSWTDGHFCAMLKKYQEVTRSFIFCNSTHILSISCGTWRSGFYILCLSGCSTVLIQCPQLWQRRLRGGSCQIYAIRRVFERIEGGERQIGAIKSTVFDPESLSKLKFHVKVSLVIQINRHFRIPPVLLTMQDSTVDSMWQNQPICWFVMSWCCKNYVK